MPLYEIVAVAGREFAIKEQEEKPEAGGAEEDEEEGNSRNSNLQLQKSQSTPAEASSLERSSQWSSSSSHSAENRLAAAWEQDATPLGKIKCSRVEAVLKMTFSVFGADDRLAMLRQILSKWRVSSAGASSDEARLLSAASHRIKQVMTAAVETSQLANADE
jgi:hypothetical protein